MKFTIYRGSWVRGGSKNIFKFGESALLNNYNRQCCLGQICSQVGIPSEDLKELGWPSSTPVRFHDTLRSIGLMTPKEIFDGDNDTGAVNMCVDYNDTFSISDKVREGYIKEQLEPLGHKIVFKNGVAPWLQESV